MGTVIQELQNWANQLEYWKRFALDKLIGGFRASDFTEADYDLMVKYLLEDANLYDVTSEERIDIDFTSAEDGNGTPILTTLVSLSDLKNVNALVDGQRLTFGPNLTAVYGNNGAGKSGYARVLGCAGFTRGAYEVLIDVLKSEEEAEDPEALITISDGNQEIPLHYTKGKKFVELSWSYIFDTENVRTLLTKENKLNFSPSGVFPLTELVIVVDEVKKRLQTLIDDKNKPHNLQLLFQDESLVSKQLENLGRETDLSVLHGLASLTDEEEQRLTQLDKEITGLKARDVEQEIQKIEKKVKDLQALHKHLQDIGTLLGESVTQNVIDVINNYQKIESEINEAGLDQFRSNHFSQVGTPIWHKFIISAHDLALAENRDGYSYPNQKDHCLLCDQPLSTDAHKKIHLIWEFLIAGVEKRFEDIRSKVARVRNTIGGVELDFFDESSVYTHHIAELKSELMPIIKSYVDSAQLRKDSLLKNLDQLKIEQIPHLVESPLAHVQRLMDSLGEKKAELEKENVGDKIIDLSQQLLTLEHRQILKGKLPEIEDFIKNQVWVYKATAQLPSTNAITKKHNQLLDQLISQNYIDLFQANLRDLGCPLSVRVQTHGRKGNYFKQIVIGSTHPEAKPDKILSEGEKRAVAMADFLTEIEMDKNCKCIIFDDPVTSLDVKWKEKFAKRIVAEAAHYQVIVFTHDLHFLHLLSEHAKNTNVDSVFHWVERGIHDDRPGYIHQNNSPLAEKHYRDAGIAKKYLLKAQDAQPEEREMFLQLGFAALRTTYEVFIMRTMFREAVTRWNERVMFSNISKINWDNDLAKIVEEKCGLCSRYIEGHSHSDQYAALKPTPETLETEIKAFEELKQKWPKPKQ